ncbi:MAG: hypothetical protein ACQER4_02210, partial [Bacteroidota bacterium]
MEGSIAEAIDLKTEAVQPDSSSEWVLTIHAGHLDRTQTPVRVSFPFPIEDGVYELRQTAMTQRSTGGVQRGEQVRRPAERMERREEMMQRREERMQQGEEAQPSDEMMQRRREMRQQHMQMQQVGPNHPVPDVIQVKDQRGLLVLPLLPAGRSVELVMSLEPVDEGRRTSEGNQQTGVGEETGQTGQTGNGIRHEMGDTRLSFLTGDRPLFSFLHETEPV